MLGPIAFVLLLSIYSTFCGFAIVNLGGEMNHDSQ